MTNAQSSQILKCRDDHLPVRFSADVDASTGSPQQFSLDEGSTCSWATNGTPFGFDKLRARIEPWLTALVQSEHLSLLVGSGLTHAIHGIARSGTLPGMSAANFGGMDATISSEAKRAAKVAGRDSGNVEDQIRAANELLRGLEILGGEKTNDASALRTALTTALNDFAKSILESEHKLVTAAVKQREEAFDYLVSFLMSFASRTGTRERLQIFTTNYDRYIEAGADAAGLRLIDRFVGTLAPVFRASRLDVDLHYNPPGIRGEPRYLEGVARFTKLHGSVDWVESERTIRRIGLPFGVKDPAPFVAAPGIGSTDALQLMIYPNAAKDRETASYPYVELFRDFAAATCRPNSTLICYGYSFGDEHINRVIEDMLTIPSAHLVVIAHSDPLGRIMAAYEKLGRHAQVTLLIGDHLGDLKTLVEHYLPKPAIDRTTFRMAELLKARWGTSQAANASVTPAPADDGGAAS
jgi:hypothetical protein